MEEIENMDEIKENDNVITLNGQIVTESQLQEAKDKVEGTNQIIRETKPGENHTLTRMRG
jgi:hypothetical protein